jgi:surfactin family lipopeptide synthetase C
MEDKVYFSIIEDTLKTHTNIEKVIVKNIKGQDNFTCVFLEEPTINRPSIKEIRDVLNKKIPEYLIPQRIIYLDSIQMERVNEIEDSLNVIYYRCDIDHEYVAPRNQIESILCKIWSDILKVRSIGVYDDFFLLGGNYTMARNLVAQIRSAFRYDFPISSILKSNTNINELSRMIYFYKIMQFGSFELLENMDEMFLGGTQ